MKRLLLAILLLLSCLSPVTAQERPRLDLLNPSLIPAEERIAGQPKELVAILGSGRGRGWAPLMSLAYSPDGKYLACGSRDGSVCLFDATTLSEVAVHHAHKDEVRAVAFSPDSRVLASGSFEDDPTSKGEVILWDVITGKLRVKLTGHSGHVDALAFPDGQWLAIAGQDQTIRLWDLTKSPPRLQIEVRGHRTRVSAIAFAPDGKMLVSGDATGEFRVWEVPTGKSLFTGTTEGDWFNTLAFSGDGKNLLTCTSEKVVRVFDWRDGKPAERLQLEHTERLVDMALSHDGKRLATVDNWAGVHLWDLTRQPPVEVESIGEVNPPSFFSLRVAFAPDGKTLSVIGGGSHGVRQWEVSGRVPKERRASIGPLTAAQFVAWPRGGERIIAADLEHRLWVWDWQVKQFGYGIGSWLEPIESLWNAMAVTADGQTLAATFSPGFEATTQFGGVQLWDLGNRSPRAGLRIANDFEFAFDWPSLAFAPAGKMLAAGARGRPILLIDLAGNKPRERLLSESRCGTLEPLAFSPDGKTIAFGGYGAGETFDRQSVRINDVATGKERWSFNSSSTVASRLTFSPDGRTLAVSWMDGKVTLVEVASREQRAEIKATTRESAAIAFSPNSRLLATAGKDGLVAVWSGSEKRWSVLLPGPVGSVAWAPDNRHLATANANGTVYILRIP